MCVLFCCVSGLRIRTRILNVSESLRWGLGANKKNPNTTKTLNCFVKNNNNTTHNKQTTNKTNIQNQTKNKTQIKQTQKQKHATNNKYNNKTKTNKNKQNKQTQKNKTEITNNTRNTHIYICYLLLLLCCCFCFCSALYKNKDVTCLRIFAMGVRRNMLNKNNN